MNSAAEPVGRMSKSQNFLDIWFLILITALLILGSSVFLAFDSISDSPLDDNLAQNSSTATSSVASSSTNSTGSTPSDARSVVVGSVIFTENRTVWQNLRRGNNVKIFADLVEMAGLTTLLDAQADITIFVPTDDAFTNIKLDMTPVSAKSFVESHIISSKILAVSLRNEKAELTTLSGSKLKFTTQDGKFKINQAEITIADVPSKNGLLQIINSPL